MLVLAVSALLSCVCCCWQLVLIVWCNACSLHACKFRISVWLTCILIASAEICIWTFIMWYLVSVMQCFVSFEPCCFVQFQSLKCIFSLFTKNSAWHWIQWTGSWHLFCNMLLKYHDLLIYFSHMSKMCIINCNCICILVCTVMAMVIKEFYAVCFCVSVQQEYF